MYVTMFWTSYINNHTLLLITDLSEWILNGASSQLGYTVQWLNSVTWSDQTCELLKWSCNYRKLHNTTTREQSVNIFAVAADYSQQQHKQHKQPRKKTTKIYTN